MTRSALHNFGCLTLAIVVIGCGKPDPAHRPRRSSEITDFAFLFEKNCTGCHGDDGKFGPAPPLNDPVFVALVSDDDLRKTINSGRKGTPMPAFAVAEGAHLQPAQVDALIAGIRKHWAPKPSATDTKDPPAAPIDAKKYPPYASSGPAGNPASGAKAFAQRCAGCHGDHGMGTPMTGAVNEGSFLQLMSDQALRRIIITGRPDLGMPDCRRLDSKPPESPITDQEIKDIVALLAMWREASLEEAGPPAPSGSK